MQGFEVVLPDKATMEHTVIPAIEAVSRKDMVRAVNSVIVASDDMRDLLPQNNPLLKKCIY